MGSIYSLAPFHTGQGVHLQEALAWALQGSHGLWSHNVSQDALGQGPTSGRHGMRRGPLRFTHGLMAGHLSMSGWEHISKKILIILQAMIIAAKARESPEDLRGEEST